MELDRKILSEIAVSYPETFNEIIDRVDAIYAPIVKKRGGTLSWARNWSDGTVNASAQRFFWTYKVNMYIYQ